MQSSAWAKQSRAWAQQSRAWRHQNRLERIAFLAEFGKGGPGRSKVGPGRSKTGPWRNKASVLVKTVSFKDWDIRKCVWTAQAREDHLSVGVVETAADCIDCGNSAET